MQTTMMAGGNGPAEKLYLGGGDEKGEQAVRKSLSCRSDVAFAL